MLPLRLTASAILFLSCAAFGANISRAQDTQDQSVAEAARQERSRKQEQQKNAKHVYTEEDLKHPRILTPEDRAQIEAKRNECAQKNNCSPAPTQNPPAALDTNSQTYGTSLGEVARQYRKQKELQALEPKQSEPFHLPFSTPALASPVLPERAAIRPPAQPSSRPDLHPQTLSHISRRDPFAPVRVRPEIRRPEVARPEIGSIVREEDVRPDLRPSVRENIHPTLRPKVNNDVQFKAHGDPLPIIGYYYHPHPKLRARRRLISPAPPKISSRLAAPSFAIQPMQPTSPAELAQPVTPVKTVRPIQPASSLPASPVSAQKTVSVQPGDSLWKLAQRNLGRGGRWAELLAANRWIADPNKIHIGSRLVLPVVAATDASRCNATDDAALTIKARKGDTLWNLAKANLGGSSYWRCLASANPAIGNPDRIYVGQELVVPSGCTTGTHAPLAGIRP